MSTYRALVVDRDGDKVSVNISDLHTHEFPDSDVQIHVKHSSVNYKDGLAVQADGNVVRQYPIVPGIDLSGTVLNSRDGRFQPGDKVLVTGYGLGVSHYGGYSEYASVPADWVVKCPPALSLKEAMIIGTAGFTAGLAVRKLVHNGVSPEQGPVLVTGASGGVGTMAVMILDALGFEVTASTGKPDAPPLLEQLGATRVINRSEVLTSKPLGKQSWAAAVDPVGGATLTSLFSTLQYGGSVAACGLTGGHALKDASVFPFILRGINLLGIDSVHVPMDERLKVWDFLAHEINIKERLQLIVNELNLEQLSEALPRILQGGVTGRTIVNL